MRIFNGTNSQIDLPLTGAVRLSIAPHAPSKDFAPNNDFLALIVTTYDEKEIALIVGGPYELSMCSTIPAAAPLLVQSLDEAVARFSTKQEVVVEEPKEEVKVEVEETNQVPELELGPDESVAAEVVAVEEEKPKKSGKKGKKAAHQQNETESNN